MFKSSRKRVVFVIATLLLVVLVSTPVFEAIQIAFAAPFSMTRKWRTSISAPGGYEGGFTIGDVLKNSQNPGEEIVYAGRGGAYLLDPDDGSILTTSRAGVVEWPHLDSAIGVFAQPCMYDVNNDGNLEVMIPLYYPPGLLCLNGDGTTLWRTAFNQGSGAMSIMSSLVAGDIDKGDGGKLEIFIAGQDVVAPFRGRIYKLSSTGAILAQAFNWRSCSGGLSLADADHDGQFEIYQGDRDIYMGDGDYGKGVRSYWASNLTERWIHPDVLCSSQCPNLADVNKDGVLEVIVSNQRGGLVVLNSTTGNPIKEQSQIPLWGSAPNAAFPGHYQMTVYDIDGDGNLEVISADGSHPSSSWPDSEIVVIDLVKWMSGASRDEYTEARLVYDTVGDKTTGQFGPTLADVNDDGKMEIIGCGALGLSVWGLPYDPVTKTYTLLFRDVWTTAGQFAIVQDIDTDGKVEVVISATAGYRILAWDTNAAKPAQRVRSEIKWYSEYRRGAAEYIAPPSAAQNAGALSELPTISASAESTIGGETAGFLVVRGQDDGIYYRKYNASDNSWKPWIKLPGTTFESPAAAMLQSMLHLVIRGESNGEILHGYVDLGTDEFSGWTMLSGATPSAPTLASNGTALSLVVRGEDNTIYHRLYTGVWGEWHAIPTGATGDDPAAAMLGKNLSIVVRGMDGSSLWHIIVQANGAVTRNWIPISGATSSRPGLAASKNINKLYLTVRGLDDTIHYREYNASNDLWAVWSSLTGSTIDGPGATKLNDKLSFVVRGSDGNTLWHGRINLSDNGFLGWELLDGAAASAPTFASAAESEPIYTIYLKSRQNNTATLNLGTITFNGTLHTLPDSVSARAGSYSALYNPDSAYAFDRWETAGGVSVSTPSNPSTTVTVTGDGNLTARYKSIASTNPILTSTLGTNTTAEDLTCYAGVGQTKPYYNFTVNGKPTTGLFLTFDTQSSTDTLDYSGYGNNGEIYGAEWRSNGMLDGAYYFDGKFDYIKVPDGGLGYFNGVPDYTRPTLGGDGTCSEITVELWVYLQKDQGDTRFVCKLPSYEIGVDSSQRLFATVWLQNSTTYTDIGYIGRSTVKQPSGQKLTSRTWHHVAFTYKADVGLKLYLDGERVAQSSTPAKVPWITRNIHCSSGNPLYLGWFNYFNGMMDEVRLYPRCLSSQGIANRYEETHDGWTNKATISSEDTLGAETWRCKVISGGAGKLSNRLTIVNNPPVAGNLTIGPRNTLDPIDTDSLVAIYDFFDMDRQTESGSQIRWYRNSGSGFQLVSALNNLKTVSSSYLAANQQWYFTVQPSDGSNLGQIETSDTVTIATNTAPTIPGAVSLTENGSGDLICSATTSDPDDTERTLFNWYQGGQSQSNSLTYMDMSFDSEDILTARDQSPYNNNGVIYHPSAATGPVWTPNGKIGGAYEFDGTDLIKVPDSGANLGQGATQLSIEFWIKLSQRQNGTRIIGRKLAYAGGGSYLVGFQTNPDPGVSNQLFFDVSVTGGEGPSTGEVTGLGAVLSTGDWHHVICTYNAVLPDGFLAIYVDGALAESSTFSLGTYNGQIAGAGISPVSGDEALYIGSDGGGSTSRTLKGTLDEIKIYRNRALTEEQAKQSYDETKNGPNTTATLVSEETSPGQTWYCQAIPIDKYHYGAAKFSNSVTT